MEVCREFGWDYYTYNNQPAWFIEEINLILKQERETQARQAKKNG